MTATAQTQQSGIQTVTLDAPVTTVTLLEDRAQVQRRCSVNLEVGFWRVRVERVAPVLADKSLRAEFLAPYPQARIDDVRAHRHMLLKGWLNGEVPSAAEIVADNSLKSCPATLEDLLQKLQALGDHFNEVTQDRTHQEHCFDQIHTILEKGLQELPVDAIWGQVNPTVWREQLQTLFVQLRELRRDIIDSYYTQEQLNQHIQDLIPQIQALAQPTLIYNAHIETDLMIPQAGTYELAFDYVVPHALWRPAHRAHLQQAASGGASSQGEAAHTSHTLTFQVEGCVWQRTGEDWTDVDLIFSTAQSSLGTEPPLLSDDLLRVKEKSTTISVQARDQRLQKPGMGQGQSSNQVELPGVDDGGEIRTLRSPTKATIPSDGQPYRIPLVAFEAPAQVEWILVPELSQQVVLRSEHTNTSPYPLLAGPVDLICTTEFVGHTTIPFIAPGEHFALGWGPDGTMRVQRLQKRTKEENPETGWQTTTNTTTLYLSNIGADPKVIKTTERVPVSELEQVQVKVLGEETTDAIQPDANGFCTWQFTLPPYSQQQATLVYQVTAAPEVTGL